ncbi:MAG: ABC transporter permease [Bdellovibrionaceae bacterium]|nr:ABC transporter permease [Bdellovibrio sp.]
MKFKFWIAYRLLFSRQILFGGSAPLAFASLVLGVAALVASMAVMSGYVETLKSAMTDVTGDIQVVRRGRLVDDWAQFSKKLRTTEPRIQALARFGYAESILAHKGQVSGVLFQGVELLDLKKVLNLEKRIKSGALTLNEEQIVIGLGLAKKFNIQVGEKIFIVVPLATPFDSSGFRRQSKEFTVTGILDFGKNEWNERLILGDLKSLQGLTEIGDRYTGAFIKLLDRNDSTAAVTNLMDQLGAGYSVMDWYEVNRNLFEAVSIERAVIFIVVLLIVIVAAFNISSTLYVFIRQKYSDIAILKALGLSRKKIRTIFLGQGLIVGALGTGLGFFLGYLLCVGFMYLQNHFALISGSVYKIDKIQTQIRWLDLSVIGFSTIVICLIATYSPAVKGSELEVVEGLKNG